VFTVIVSAKADKTNRLASEKPAVSMAFNVGGVTGKSLRRAAAVAGRAVDGAVLLWFDGGSARHQSAMYGPLSWLRR